jgi:anti-sigma factor RsiW
MERVDDVMLMAYVDGEVDAATAREIEAAIAADPAVAARAQRLRNSAVMARAAFADALHEPVPERLRLQPNIGRPTSG